MKTKSERREKVRKNNRKMVVRGRSVFVIRKIKIDKANKNAKKS